MPGHEELMAAFWLMLKANPNILSKKTEKITGNSMPSIYQRVKRIGEASRIISKAEELAGERDYDRIALHLAQKIFESPEEKVGGLMMLEQLNLPRYTKIKTTVADFLADPEIIFAKIPADRFFPSVTSSLDSLRYFDLNLDKEEVLVFLNDMLQQRKICGADLLIISEFQKNAFSGNIIINPPTGINSFSGERITAELVKGEHTGLAYGGALPAIRTKENLFNNLQFEVLLDDGLSKGLLKFLSNFTDVNKNKYVDFWQFEAACQSEFAKAKDVRKLVYYKKLIKSLCGVMNLIPKNTGRRSSFSENDKTSHPGYYEFILNSAMEVFFLDYRPADKYSDLQ